MDLLKELNPQQRLAVTAEEGQTLVLAGPGSGKTRVLTHRIAYLIDELGVRPYNILAVTFTNKAAREMESRVSKLLGRTAEGLFLGTFHGVCSRILRRESEYLPISSSFVIFDTDDQENLVKRALRELQINEKIYRPNAIHAAISRAKNELITPDVYPVVTYRDEVARRVFARYQELLLSCNAVDFDDLLVYTVRLLDENPTVRERWAYRFRHVLVDEFQDTNQAQYNMLRYLSSVHGNLFVVGDEDQSIYRWRGADYRNVLRFEKDYPKAQKILLEQNYRSTQTVLDAARAVIDHNEHRTPKRLYSDRGSGQKIVLHEAPDDYAEANFVVDTISSAINAGAKGSDFAVMYRTNAQSRLLEESFLRSSLPYRLVGAQRFYGRREVKDVISFLRLVHNPADDVSLTRVINVPPRGIGEKTVQTLIAAARQGSTNAGAVLMDLAHGPDSRFWPSFTGRGAVMLAEFGSQLATWRGLAETMPLPSLLNRILSDTRYREYIDDNTEEGLNRWSNVEELQRIATEFQERGLAEFLESLALVSDQDTLPESQNAVTLLTLHAAKGLEFRQVFLIGLDDGLLPHSRSFDEPEEMAEERRLLYVGLTRAKDQLYLVRADVRGARGDFQETVPSRFLTDIPEQLVQGKRGRGSSRAGGRRSEAYTRWDGPAVPAARKAAAPVQPTVVRRYAPNMRVRHPTYGEGLVVKSEVEFGDETVEIFFASAGTKRLVASLAKLEILA